MYGVAASKDSVLLPYTDSLNNSWTYFSLDFPYTVDESLADGLPRRPPAFRVRSPDMQRRSGMVREPHCDVSGCTLPSLFDKQRGKGARDRLFSGRKTSARRHLSLTPTCRVR